MLSYFTRFSVGFVTVMAFIFYSSPLVAATTTNSAAAIIRHLNRKNFIQDKKGLNWSAARKKKGTSVSHFLIGTNSKWMIYYYVNGSCRMYTDGYELYIANIIYCSIFGKSFSATLLLFEQFSTLS